MAKQDKKVTGYIPPELNQRFEEWMKENSIRSASQGVWLIMEHYLTGKKPLPLIEQEVVDQYQIVQDLVARVTELEQASKAVVDSMYSAGAKQLAPYCQSSSEPPTELVEIEYSPGEAAKGLTKTELSRKIGLSVSQVNSFAQKHSVSAEEYLLMVTHWQAGSGERPRYFPAKALMETREIMAETAQIKSKMFSTPVE
ncbi:MAG: hypothetical protein AAF652_05030 [Cyanobacteria bacterium P01_C01_bin.72]